MYLVKGNNAILYVYAICYSTGMGHNNKPETNLQDSSAQASLPKDGLRILARIITRHRERERKQVQPVDSTEGGASDGE